MFEILLLLLIIIFCAKIIFKRQLYCIVIMTLDVVTILINLILTQDLVILHFFKLIIDNKGDFIMSNINVSSLNGGGNNNVIIRCPDYNLIYKLFIDDINEYDFNGSIPHSTKKTTFNLYLVMSDNSRVWFESNICQNNTNSYSINEPFDHNFKPSNSLIYRKSIPTNIEKSNFSAYHQYIYTDYTGANTQWFYCSLYFRPVFEFNQE